MPLMLTRRRLATLALAGLTPLLGAPPAQAASKKHGSKRAAARPVLGKAYGRRADAVALANRLAQVHGLDAGWTRAQLAQAHFVAQVTQLIMPPPVGVAKNWGSYRDRFIEPKRVQAGVRFWQDNEAWLAQAEQRYGVPASVVVGIIGVETFYGRITGQFRVLDALATLSLDFPKGRSDRSAFFQDELGQYLALVHREQIDPLSVKGSYAGAIGLGQFMPGSINRFAVDFDGNGHIDMAGSAADVIGSVAHYLAEHGWQRGLPTHFAVVPPAAGSPGLQALQAPDIKPSFTPAQLAEQGAELATAGREHPGKLALITLQMGDAEPVYVAGTDNFYAVTRYNWSAYYALGVIELGQAVAQARQALLSAPAGVPAAPAASAASKP